MKSKNIFKRFSKKSRKPRSRKPRSRKPRSRKPRSRKPRKIFIGPFFSNKRTKLKRKITKDLKESRKKRNQELLELKESRKKRNQELLELNNACYNGTEIDIRRILNSNPETYFRTKIDKDKHPIVPKKCNALLNHPKIIDEIVKFAKNNFSKKELQNVINDLTHTVLLLAVETGYNLDRRDYSKKPKKDTRSIPKNHKKALSLVKKMLKLGANKFSLNFESGEIDETILKLLEPYTDISTGKTVPHYYSKRAVYPVNAVKTKYYKV